MSRLNSTPAGGCDTRQFLDALFPAESAGWIEVRLIVDKKGGALVHRHWYGGAEQLVAALPMLMTLSDANNAGVFSGVLPRTVSGRGKAADIAPGTCVWVDIDFKDFPDEATARERLDELPLPPSIIVRSGHGLHAYWLLREPVPAAELSEIAKSLASAVGGDHAHDAARILRLPGTFNLKDPENPLPVEIELLDPDRAYNLSEIVDVLDMLGPVPDPVHTVDVGEITISDDLPESIRGLLLTKKRLASLFNGEGKPEFGLDGGRLDSSSSGYDFSLLMSLIRAGVRDPNDLVSALWHRPDGVAQQKGTGYIKRSVAKALGGVCAAEEAAVGAAINFTVEKVFVYNSDPARFRLVIDGKDLVLSSIELRQKGKFGTRFLDLMHFAASLPSKADEWLMTINGWLAESESIEMPPEASDESAIRTLIQRVVADLPLGETGDDLERGMAVQVSDGATGFKADAVLLRVQEKHPKAQRGDVCRILRDLGFDSVTTRVGGESVRLWQLVTALHRAHVEREEKKDA